MLILICSVTFLIIGIVLLRRFDNGLDEVGVPIIALSVLIIAFWLIMLPSMYYGNKTDILEFEETRRTYTTARKNGVDIKTAAIQLDIAEKNRWLARVKYWNETTFDCFIPDEVMKIEPIRGNHKMIIRKCDNCNKILDGIYYTIGEIEYTSKENLVQFTHIDSTDVSWIDPRGWDFCETCWSKLLKHLKEFNILKDE
jgi:hypothetical protein